VYFDITGLGFAPPSVADQINKESYNQDFGTYVGSLTAKKHPFAISAITADSVAKGTNISLQYQLLVAT